MAYIKGQKVLFSSNVNIVEGGGTTPSGTINITENGKHDVAKYSSAIVNVAGSGQYVCRVIDYDGTILKEEYHDEGDIFTLPDMPTHDGLVAQGFSSPIDIVNNQVTVGNSDITIGVMYTTASGLSEFDITLTKVTGLDVILNMDGTKDWGDGTTNTETTHTYADYGNYTITCDGSTIATGTYNGMFGQPKVTSDANYYCTNVRFGSNVTAISDYTFEECFSLKNITIPNSVSSIGEDAFTDCKSLTSITIPNGVTSISAYTFRGCQSLTNVAIPSSITSIGSYAFYTCYSLTSITIPNGVTSIGGSEVFRGCQALTNITIPNSVNVACGIRNFQECYSLRNIIMSTGVTSIDGSAFCDCNSLTSITIPNGVTSIGSSAFQDCMVLTNITIPNSVTNIGTASFINCNAIVQYDFSNHTSVPTLSATNAFNSMNKVCKIIVPDSLYDEWIAATNWSTYADYIYKASEVTA